MSDSVPQFINLYSKTLFASLEKQRIGWWQSVGVFFVCAMQCTLAEECCKLCSTTSLPTTIQLIILLSVSDFQFLLSSLHYDLAYISFFTYIHFFHLFPHTFLAVEFVHFEEFAHFLWNFVPLEFFLLEELRRICIYQMHRMHTIRYTKCAYFFANNRLSKNALRNDVPESGAEEH